MPMRTHLYEHAGIRFSVSETGEGLPMLFQHGLCGDALQPAEVFPSESGWRCLTLECRGHGHSEAGSPDEFSIATFAEDLVSLIEARNLAPVVVGGISMGAALALRLAVLRPDLVRALVLARPAWTTEAAPFNMQINALVGDLLRRYPPEQAQARFEASEIARNLAINAPDNLASLRSFFSRQPLSVTQDLLCRISADGPGVSRSEIEAIHIPALVIGSARDMIHPLAKAQELATMIPGATLIEITPKAENKDFYRRDFTAALLAFLKELEP
jgi:pimeloyl-ACP methyl ester carboxylesterase